MSGQQLALAFLGVIGAAWIFSKIGRAAAGLLLVLTAPLVGVWMLVHSVQSFTGTVRVATVQASPIANAPHTMAISLTTYDADGNPTRQEVELSGDRWELNCDVVRYYDWATWLRLQSAYSCGRITSQYDDSQAHMIQPVTLPHGTTFAIPLLERTHYRNGVLEPADSVTYNVYIDVKGDMWAVHA